MIDYAVVLVPVCLTALAASCLTLSAQRQVCAALVLVLTLFAAVRGYVGTDTGAYHGMFFEFGGDRLDDLIRVMEPVFAAWLKLSALASDSSFTFVSGIAVFQGLLLLLTLQHHQQPASFLALYAATFFVNFHFNVLRAGVAALFLLLALASLSAGRRVTFQSYGVLSILSHYSSVLFIVPMNLIGRRIGKGIAWVAFSGLVAAGLIYLFVDEARYMQYLTYLALYDAGESVSYGLGLVALMALYAAIYAATVSTSTFKSLTFLLVLWAVLRVASNHLLFISRIEIIVNLLLLYALIGHEPSPKHRVRRQLAIALLVLLNLYGTLNGLEGSDQSTRGGFMNDPTRRNSTYLPYRFAWEE